MPDDYEQVPAGYWRLYEGLGNVAGDSSPNGNDGDVLGALWSSETADGSPFSLSFDGQDDSVELDSIDVAGTALSFAAWLGSQPKTGLLDVDPGVALSIGNQPPGAGTAHSTAGSTTCACTRGPCHPGSSSNWPETDSRSLWPAYGRGEETGRADGSGAAR